MLPFSRRFLHRLLLSLAAFAAGGPVAAASLTVTLTDQKGAPVEDAVVYVVNVDGKIGPLKPQATQTVRIDQINKTFVPHVRAVVVGSNVNFPNSDNIRHQVYSQSEAKTFELPLYIGQPAAPVLFDKAGIVTLGCNIHDQMIGYILVLNTPWFAEVHDGKATIANVPAGHWAVEIWHPRLAQEKAVQLTLDATGGNDVTLNRQLDVLPKRMTMRAPHRGDSHY